MIQIKKHQQVIQQKISIKNHNLKNQIDKLLSITKIIKQINTSFIFGYASWINSQDIDLQQYLLLKNKIDNLFELEKDGIIKNENILELIAYIKIKIIQQKRSDIKYFNIYIDEILGQLALDNSYIKKIYLGYQNQMDLPSLLALAKRSNSKIGSQCLICCQQLTMTNLSPLACGHLFHLSCFQKYLQIKVASKSLPMLCPGSQQCRQFIQNKDIQQYADKQTLKKYQQFTFQVYIEKHQSNTSWCPTAGCSSVFEFDETLKEYRCPSCKKHYCLLCRTQMHINITCQENRQINKLPQEEKLFLKFAKGARFKQCPACKFWVERTQGCDHMKCRCTYQFCYKCGGKYQACACCGK